jgi:carbon monoxide dehydrogenase subunit G
MEKYESKQYQINRPAEDMYRVLSDFSHFTPIIQDKVEDWQATENSCSFKLKGFTMRLNIVDKVPFEYIKIGTDDSSPIEFAFWIQFKQVAPRDTRMKLTMHANLNMMMRMMIGSKLRDGIDQMAQQIADAFNGILGNMPNPYADFEELEASGLDLNAFNFGGKEKLPS